VSILFKTGHTQLATALRGGSCHVTQKLLKVGEGTSKMIKIPIFYYRLTTKYLYMQQALAKQIKHYLRRTLVQ
jgi:hypothetical protein